MKDNNNYKVIMVEMRNLSKTLTEFKKDTKEQFKESKVWFEDLKKVISEKYVSKSEYEYTKARSIENENRLESAEQYIVSVKSQVKLLRWLGGFLGVGTIVSIIKILMEVI